MNWQIILLAFLISCITSFLLLPLIKNWVQKKKLLNEDRNKFQKPRITSLEGLISILIFFLTISALLIVVTLSGISIRLDLIYTGLLTITLISFIGFIDDILGFPSRSIKIVFFIFSLVPIMAALFGNKELFSENKIDVSIIFSIIIAPLIIALSSLSVNAIKSFNKVNLNSGIIVIITLFFISVFKNELMATIILSTVGGIFLFLHIFNYNKMKISLGRVGRMSFGAIFAISAIFAKAIVPLLILLIPYIIYSIFYKKKFDKEQRLLRARGALDDSPEQKTKFENLFLIMTLSEIMCAVIAILIQM